VAVSGGCGNSYPEACCEAQRVHKMGSGSNPVNAENMKGKLRDELDTPHLNRVALHFQFARDFYLLADEFLSSQWVAESFHWILQLPFFVQCIR
jgi:hypothetical protein